MKNTDIQIELQKIKDAQARIKQLKTVSRPELARRILSYRKQKGMTQTELGNAIGLSRSMVANIELGTNQATLKHLMQLCEIFNVTPNDLLI